MADAEVKSENAGDYFRLPTFLALILIPLGVTLVTLCTFCPDVVPYTMLGPVGQLAQHLVLKMPQVMHGLCYMTWLVHLGESYCAGRVARSKGLTEATRKKWMILVFFYGIFAFKHLLSYQPPPQKAKAE